MKKVFMTIAVVAMMIAVSACGNNTPKAAEAEAEAVEVCDEKCDECAACDSTCTEACDSTAVETIVAE